MADKSSIEWTDATWNPITGCSVVSPGCTNCYAMRLAGSRLKHHPSRAGLTIDTKAGPVWNGEVRLNEQWLDQPLRWTRPRMVFVCAHGDLFHESVHDEWIDRVFAIMALAPQHTFQVLTKRAGRMRMYLAGRDKRRRTRMEAVEVAGMNMVMEGIVPQARATTWPLSNVWIGVSAEDQTRADERREDLRSLANNGWLTWVSYEPALGPIDWVGWEFVHWIVSGGENGPRPSHPSWHRCTRDFCAVHSILYCFKQWGSWRHAPDRAHFKELIREPWTRVASGIDGVRPAFSVKEGKKAAGRLLDGRTHDEFPKPREAPAL